MTHAPEKIWQREDRRAFQIARYLRARSESAQLLPPSILCKADEFAASFPILSQTALSHHNKTLILKRESSRTKYMKASAGNITQPQFS